MHQLLNSSQQQYERSSSGHRSQELHHIQQEQRSSSPDLQWRRRAWSMTRTLRLILAGWQAPSELIDHCWEVFWIHLSCRETALQQHRHWATEAEGMETERWAQYNTSCKMLTVFHPSVGKEMGMIPRRMWSRLQCASKQQSILDAEVRRFLVLGTDSCDEAL